MVSLPPDIAGLSRLSALLDYSDQEKRAHVYLVVCYLPRLSHSMGLIHASWIVSQVRSLLLPISPVTFLPLECHHLPTCVAHLNHEPTTFAG